MGQFETIEAGSTTTRLYEVGEVRPGAPGPKPSIRKRAALGRSRDQGG